MVFQRADWFNLCLRRTFYLTISEKRKPSLVQHTAMALEDICGFKDTPVHHKWFPISPFEDSSIQKTDYYNFGTRTPKTSRSNYEIPLHFFIPAMSNSFSFNHRLPFSPKHSETVSRPFPLCHGTTTLGFIFQVVTSSGSGADCMLWERILTREIRLYQLRHRHRLSISGTAKLLSFMLHPFKGTNVCVALTLCGWDKEVATSSNSGPKVIYVCSDGARLQGDIFSVGSGSPYAYGVLDGELKWSLSEEEAISLAREAVFRATHRDAYSGNNVDLFHVTSQGWSQRKREDLKEEYYRDIKRREKMVEERKRLIK
ncbi:proteasome subunit beta type-11a isoform X1 [Notolabrus celidotus]|uniref:proteasome subunit beta type-11a isoform X1 n=1 Tax=Notolabrus celidotus TaxID=1203425 RepID=UPI00148F7A45|nr:proteasome subunit beta type-11a isoform X1 [Notolabrus celidotus]